METTIKTVLVADWDAIEPNTGRTLKDLFNDAIGLDRYSGPSRAKPRGAQFEVTLTVRSITAPRWTVCKQLTYYGDQVCDTLLEPGTECNGTHFHKPQPVERSAASTDNPNTVSLWTGCTECERLGIEAPTNLGPNYNHPNA